MTGLPSQGWVPARRGTGFFYMQKACNSLVFLVPGTLDASGGFIWSVSLMEPALGETSRKAFFMLGCACGGASMPVYVDRSECFDIFFIHGTGSD
jgi:hypothetical protein